MKNILNKLIRTKEELERVVISCFQENSSCKVTYFNQHAYNVAVLDAEYASFLTNDFIVYPDGVGIRLALKYLYNWKLENYNATDFNYDLIDMLESRKIKYYFIGGNYDDLFVSRFMVGKNYYAGYHNGYNINERELVEKIKSINPRVIIIGMGVPLQEKLATILSSQIEGKMIFCVGNFLEFYFGEIRRVPSIFVNSGIEWIYRLFQEPRRLYKRYLVGIPLFILRVIIEKSKK